MLAETRSCGGGLRYDLILILILILIPGDWLKYKLMARASSLVIAIVGPLALLSILIGRRPSI
ncbi:hypothetical protein [Pontibacter ruber]|uniref:Uncharacterized protein n=1 Tax=Pontibacter ruber TaxID=1343895 RepID=A0ABW5CVE9_9BACT|nr:hypothetical protein [Pontibacter ruber]